MEKMVDSMKGKCNRYIIFIILIVSLSWIWTGTGVIDVDNFGYTLNGGNDRYCAPMFDWIEISDTGKEILPNSDDLVETNISLGFSFNYYGTGYSKLAISNNGLLFSGVASSQWTNQPIKNSPYVHGFIAPFWDDLVTFGSAGSIYYKTMGAEPNRMFVVEWKDVQHYYSSPEGISFEAILYEGSNNIKFQYLDTTFGLASYDYGKSATVGIESPDGKDGLQYSYNTPAINPKLAILFIFPGSDPGPRFCPIPSYEELLRSQTSLIGSFENLLKNTSLNSSMSYMFLDSFDDLADRQQHDLFSFEDLVSYNWSDLDENEKIILTESFEDLLRREATILTSNEDLLKRGFCKLSTDEKKELLDRFEARLKSEMDLLKKFEDWLHYQQMIEDSGYETWIDFLSSFEDLIRRQSNLLASFEMLMKLDCTEEYINVTKSTNATGHVIPGQVVEYKYVINATNLGFPIKDVVVKDSLWGVVGTIANLQPGLLHTLKLNKTLNCTECNNCTCKVCNFATVCGEVITPNGNFTVCDISNDLCAIVSENPGTSPFYPGKKVDETTVEQAPAIEATEAFGKPIHGDVPVTIYFDRYPGRSPESEGFDVYVDEKYIGRGTGDSFSFTVTEGNHEIRVNDGRQDYQKSMIFQSGVPKVIFVNEE